MTDPKPTVKPVTKSTEVVIPKPETSKSMSIWEEKIWGLSFGFGKYYQVYFHPLLRYS